MSHRLKLMLTAVFALLIVFGHLIPADGWGLLHSSLRNALHMFVFASATAICLIAYRPERFFVFSMLAATAAFVLGICGETLQQLSGMKYDSADIIRDVGATIFVCLIYIATRLLKHRHSIIAANIAAAVAVAIVSIPLLAQLYYLAKAKHAEPAKVTSTLPWTDDFARAMNSEISIDRFASENMENPQRAHKITLQDGSYSGVEYSPIRTNWQDYEFLTFDAYASIDELRIVVRIDDDAHNGQYEDRYNEAFVLMRRLQRFEVPLSDIASAPGNRALKLTNIERLLVFSPDTSSQPSIYLSEFTLK